MDYAFTDRDVRTNPHLSATAKEYLRNYKGSFEPMLAALGRISQGADLEIAHVRMVLNVMRADPSVRIVHDDEPVGDNVIPIRRHFMDGHEEELHTPKLRREKFRVAGKVKGIYPYGMSAHKTSQTIHVVDSERSVFEFRRAGTTDYNRKLGHHVVGHDRLHIELAWLCSQKHPKIRLLTWQEADYLVDNRLMRWCMVCYQLADNG